MLSKSAIRKAQSATAPSTGLSSELATGKPSEVIENHGKPIRSASRYEGVRSSEIRPLGSVERYVEVISSHWGKARRSLIDIGRYLNAARSDPSVPEGEFMRMMKERLPFSWETAHQLRSVAEAIDSGRFNEDELPSAHTVAYQLVTLDERAEKLAREKGLVKPTVSRSAIIRFKNSLRPNKAIDRRRLELERDKLRARLKEIEKLLHADSFGHDRSGSIIDSTASLIEEK
jgi:hypothetical protein